MRRFPAFVLGLVAAKWVLSVALAALSPQDALRSASDSRISLDLRCYYLQKPNSFKVAFFCGAEILGWPKRSFGFK